MNEFPLPHILDFLQKIVLFNTLDRTVIKQIIADTQIAFYPKDEIIIKHGEGSSGFLYVVQTGCARVTITNDAGAEILVELRGEGDIFGAISLLQGQKGLFNVIVDEDLIVFLIPKGVMETLLIEHDDFKRYFGSSLARNFQAVRKSADHQLTLFTRDNQLSIDKFLTGKRVHIRRGKGHKDRLVPLPDFTYEGLRELWKRHRHPELIFPNATGSLKKNSTGNNAYGQGRCPKSHESCGYGMRH